MSTLSAIFDDSDEAQAAKSLGLSADDLRTFFAEFDTDGSGMIDESEFGTLLAMAGKTLESDQIHKIVTSIDKDGNGQIDFKEFCSWWVSNGDEYESSCGEQPVPYYEYDYDLSPEENDEAERRFYDEAEARQTELHGSWDQQYERKESQNMLKAKLMAPLYFKKLAAKMKTLSERPSDLCTNDITVQVGQPQDKGSARVYSAHGSDWDSLNAPKHTAAAFVVDFSLCDDFNEDSIKFLQDTARSMFEKFIEPMLSEVNKVPKELRKTGLLKGKPFDSYTLQVEEVDGQKVLRLAVYSGVDVLGAWTEESQADIAKVMPTAQLKFTTGFSLADLTASGDTPLSDMLQFKLEGSFNWTKNFIVLVMEFAELMRKLEGNIDSYQLRDMKRARYGVTAFTKAFTAQRSLFYFQFATLFEWAKEMIKEVGLPMFLEEVERESPPFWKGPPSQETLDNIVDAVGALTGKTFNAVREHLLADPKLDKYTDDGRKWGTILWVFKKEWKIAEAIEEAAKEDGHPEAKLMAQLWEAAGHAQKCIRGLNGARFMDKIATVGAEFKGFDFMQFVPLTEDVMASEGSDDRCTWVELFARNFQGDDSKGSVDEAFMEKLKEEASELANVVKVAWELRECIDIAWLDEQSGGMASKAEGEAQKFFDI
jgi:hypothetical protein